MRESQVRYFGVRKIRQRFGWKTKNVYRLSACFNRSISGKLEIRKEGEVPEAEIKDQKLQKIVYETKGLKGAEYDLVAAETIPHPDGYSKDLYLMGTTIAHVIT